MNTSESRPLRLGWGIFAVIATLLVTTIAVLTFLPSPDARPIRVPMWFFCASMLGFFAFRWHSLRKRVFRGQVTPEEFRQDPRRHILGPRLPLIIWFVTTLVILIGIVVIEADIYGV